jgi:DNA-directed RNA polymerase subunit K/omega
VPIIDTDHAAKKATDGNRFALTTIVAKRANQMQREGVQGESLIGAALEEAMSGHLTATKEPLPQCLT